MRRKPPYFVNRMIFHYTSTAVNIDHFRAQTLVLYAGPVKMVKSILPYHEMCRTSRDFDNVRVLLFYNAI